MSPQDLALLEEVLEARASERVHEVLEKLRGDTLAPAERTWLCELIGAELAATGFGPDSEPTSRGEHLEHLLDEINRPNIKVR